MHRRQPRPCIDADQEKQARRVSARGRRTRSAQLAPPLKPRTFNRPPPDRSAELPHARVRLHSSTRRTLPASRPQGHEASVRPVALRRSSSCASSTPGASASVSSSATPPTTSIRTTHVLSFVCLSPLASACGDDTRRASGGAPAVREGARLADVRLGTSTTATSFVKHAAQFARQCSGTARADRVIRRAAHPQQIRSVGFTRNLLTDAIENRTHRACNTAPHTPRVKMREHWSDAAPASARKHRAACTPGRSA